MIELVLKGMSAELPVIWLNLGNFHSERNGQPVRKLPPACNACGIRFSSGSTLEAHQAHYCTKVRQRTLASPPTGRVSITASASIDLSPSPLHRMKQSPGSVKRDADHDADASPTAKLLKRDDLHAGGDHAVGRRHVVGTGRDAGQRHSPSSPSPASSPRDVETYCHCCDIRFQSRDTLAVHKRFYCTLRQQYAREREPMPIPPPPPPPPPLPGYVADADALQHMSSQRPLLIQSLLPDGATPVSLAGALPGGANIVLVPCLVPSVIVPAVSAAGGHPLDLAASHLAADVRPNTVRAHGGARATVGDGAGGGGGGGGGGDEQQSPLDLCTRKSDASSKSSPGGSVGERTTCETTAADASMTTVARDTASAHLTPTASPAPVATAAAAAQAFLRKGVSHCVECNIVFFSHENYLVHKQYYCSSRQYAAFPAPPPPPPPPASRPSASPPPPAAEPSNEPPSVKTERASMPASPTASGGGGSGSGVPRCCITCGISFMSIDTLQAHQLYYCPARHELVRDGATHPPPPPPPAPQPRDEACACDGGTLAGVQLYRRHASGERVWRCYVCGVARDSELQLSEHLRLHRLLSVFECTTCGYRGGTVRGMRMHAKVHGDGADPDAKILQIVIPQAPEEGATEEVLDGEIEAILSKQRPYRRRMSRRGSWRRPFPCECCALTFESFVQLSAAASVNGDEAASVDARSCDDWTERESRVGVAVKQEPASDNEVGASRDVSPGASPQSETVRQSPSETLRHVEALGQSSSSGHPSSSPPSSGETTRRRSSLHDSLTRSSPTDEPWKQAATTVDRMSGTVELGVTTVTVKTEVHEKEEDAEDEEEEADDSCAAHPDSSKSPPPENERTNEVDSAELSISNKKKKETTAAAAAAAAEEEEEEEEADALTAATSVGLLFRARVNGEKEDAASSTARSSPPPPPPPAAPEHGSVADKHCTNCNITFTYLHSFIAHKKYYCQPQNGERHPMLSQNHGTMSPSSIAQT
ncbi:PREDICTED: zinc finger protein ZFPM1-like [Priapulus caudatus]|uniref:Zinc finger protein ZFPM1-like n=1 Tax=Priapulus caudatus TaxID=37621 RepID=A0ABM1E657_PRICU|nr:PREDICTED: zinc finger protein ZFPM1-like [Priapulus caudatus]